MSPSWSEALHLLYVRMTRVKSVEAARQQDEGETALKKNLHWYDLLGLGVGCIIGAGLFVLTGVAAREAAGPAIVLSYLFAGVACVFSGLCYAEFAARIPVAGSAYVYAYCTMGEFCAWIVGWNLILEYVVAVAAVARGWSSYLAMLLQGISLTYPDVLYKIEFNCANMTAEADTGPVYTESCSTIDMTAFTVTLLLTLLTAVGTKQSSTVNGVMMILTLLTIFFVIFVGSAYVDTSNWSNFFPFGVHGMVHGAAVIFFSYVGFDSVSTFAEETVNPKRDMPIGVVGSILISTALYCAVALVITGMVPYYDIDPNAPLAAAFAIHGLPWAQVVVSLGAFLALTTTILTSLMGMPRIFLAMARDGLFFPLFKYVSPRFNTPFYGAWITGVSAAVLALALDIELLADMVSIGTLFAFYIVCASVVILRLKTPQNPMRGTVLILILTCLLVPPLVVVTVPDMHPALIVIMWLLPIPPVVQLFREPRNPPISTSFATPLVPLVPILGMMANLYLMINLGAMTWVRLIVWIIIGFLIYVFYGMTHSKLEKSSGHGEASIAFDATEYQHLNEENVDAEEPSPSAVDDEGHDSDDLAYALTKPSTRTSKYSSF